MVTEPYKLSNPFPQDPVATDSGERLADFRETQCYHAAKEKLDIYREGFFLQRPGQKTGLAMGIRGEYGSGKTHLVLQLMDHLKESKTPPFKVIYSKAEFSDAKDFLKDFYVKQFARKIEFTDLRDVFSLHIAKLMRMKAPTSPSAEKTLTEIALDEVGMLLSQNPQGVLDLLEEDLLPGGNLPQLQAEVKESAKGVASDFFRAYSKLMDPVLSSTALRWIQGEELSIPEKKDLGLENRGITSSDDAREALRFMLGAFKRADYGLIFCLEEFERPVLRGSAADQQATFSLLKDLAELFKAAGHVLIVSGVSDAWDKLPADVLDRIKRTDTIQVTFTESEARGVLNAYTLTVGQRAEEMFEPGGLDLLFDISKLNARRLLSLSHHAYEVASGKIGEEHLERATNRVLSDPTRLDNLQRSIESVAGELNLTVRKTGELEGYRYDFLLGDLNDPIVAVEIKKSIFKLGEIQAARNIAESSRTLKSSHPQTSLCVIVVGYSTREVREELIKVVDRLFDYDEKTFPSDFRAFLKSIIDSAAQAKQRSIREQDYRSLDDRLNELQESRQVELDRIKAALEELQKETARRYEESSEKRRTDKMVDALSESEQLLKQEEDLGLSTSKQPSTLKATDKLDLALKVLDEQRSGLQTIAILNEKLPDANKFSAQLGNLFRLTNLSEQLWTRAYQRNESADADLFLDYFYELSGVRRLYRERKEALTVLEAMHASRMSNDPRNFLVLAYRQIRKLSVTMLLLWILAIVGLVFDVALFGSFWWRERSSVTEYLSAVSGIQGVASQISIDSTLPGSDRGETLGQTLLQNVSALDSLGTLNGLSSNERFSLFERLDAIKTRAPFLRRKISKISGPEGNYYETDAQQIVQDCRSAKSYLGNSSFLQMLAQFFRTNLGAFVAAFIPITVLLGVIFVRRARIRRDRRWIDLWNIPEIQPPRFE